MSEYRSQIQNLFLSVVRKRHQPVEVVLDTGTCLRGIIKGFDQFSITIGFHDKLEVIYKSAILYITAMPKKIRPRPAYGAPRPGGMDRPPRYSSDSRPPRDDYYDDERPPRPTDDRPPRPADERPPRPMEDRPPRPAPADDRPPRPRPPAAPPAPPTSKPPVRTPPPRAFIEIPEDIDREDPPPPKKAPRKT